MLFLNNDGSMKRDVNPPLPIGNNGTESTLNGRRLKRPLEITTSWTHKFRPVSTQSGNHFKKQKTHLAPPPLFRSNSNPHNARIGHPQPNALSPPTRSPQYFRLVSLSKTVPTFSSVTHTLELSAQSARKAADPVFQTALLQPGPQQNPSSVHFRRPIHRSYGTWNLSEPVESPFRDLSSLSDTSSEETTPKKLF